jgi:hypothetical protein
VEPVRDTVIVAVPSLCDTVKLLLVNATVSDAADPPSVLEPASDPKLDTLLHADNRAPNTPKTINRPITESFASSATLLLQ